MFIDKTRWIVVVGALVGFGCAVEVDEAQEEDRLRLAELATAACGLDADAAMDAAENVAEPSQAVAETPKCKDAEGNDITDEDTCQATKCGPKQDRTDCAWMGGARGCRCPSGACATVGQ